MWKAGLLRKRLIKIFIIAAAVIMLLLRKFLKFLIIAAAILLLLLLFPTRARSEDEGKEFKLAKVQRSLSKELGERQCGPYFIALDYGGRGEPSISFSFIKEEGQPRNDAVPKSRSAVEEIIDDAAAKPAVRLGTDGEKRMTALFILNTEDYKATEGCLPAPRKSPQK